MEQFRRFLNNACLHEIHLNGRLFTWRNERAHPTLERIDHAFISKEWDEIYPNHDLSSLPTMCFDHASLLLRTNHLLRRQKCFHFKAYWLRFLGFLEMVEMAWHCPLWDADP
jgi:hypothetical protein